jgi:uncharacterized Zn-finger protein
VHPLNKPKVCRNARILRRCCVTGQDGGHQGASLAAVVDHRLERTWCNSQNALCGSLVHQQNKRRICRTARTEQLLQHPQLLLIMDLNGTWRKDRIALYERSK